ncbi:hypothetical protein [Actinoallomurus iriomotensis]|uniref:Uncharacterized protein n=1 Tax=Actinoallomurus iriomotensis TaxID=478107 RepID=A0A9W6SCG4_9ACTN|nr:hypothetical protein [Actinoallomurus iriomotensis]GLY91339.1 hypothetical protein Airi02_092680 [Actinoallomurus iriomotensis]
MSVYLHSAVSASTWYYGGGDAGVAMALESTNGDGRRTAGRPTGTTVGTGAHAARP